MTNRITKGVVLAAMLVTTSCQDLDVVNTNNPDRDRALTSPVDVETLIASAWRNYWTRWHNGTDSYNNFPLIADVMSGTYANNAALELSSEPRPPFNNNPLSEAGAMARSNWESFYGGISSVNDGLLAIKNGLRIETATGNAAGTLSDNTMRSWTFGKWEQGVGYAYLSMIFDKAFFGTENSDLNNPADLPLIPHTELRDSAIDLLLEAADSATKYTFTLPDTWIYQQPITSAELVRLAHSYIVRAYVYGARSPQERQALPWQTIINHLDRGITADHIVNLLSGTQVSNFLSRYQNTGTFSAWGDYKMIGPADTSGNYQAWLNTPIPDRQRFLIHTPDRRITGPMSQQACLTATGSIGQPANCNGTYFRFRRDNIFRPERGTYHQSHYQWWRNQGRASTQTYAIMSVDEMRLIRAEALIRLNRAAEAVPLINVTRTRVQRIGTTNFPGLPAVTVTGVPPGPGCVPRKADGTCGDLMDALIYERMIENSMLDAYIGYFDSRGFGRLASGTFLHLPIPARELINMGLPVYSFGGVGGPGAAP